MRPAEDGDIGWTTETNGFARSPIFSGSFPCPDARGLSSCAMFFLQLEVESEAPYPLIRRLVGHQKRQVAAQLALGFVTQNDRIADDKIRRCSAINVG